MKNITNTNSSTNSTAKAPYLPLVKVRLYEGDSNTAGFVTLYFGKFAVDGITVVWSEKKQNFFVSMPSRKKSDGTYADICFPIDADYRTALYTKILSEFDRERREGSAKS